MRIYFKKELALVLVTLLILVSASVPTAAQNGLVTCEVPAETVAISDAKLYVEYNATDEDLGIHGYIGAEGWNKLCVYAPDGKQIVGVSVENQFSTLGIATLFFEGREPSMNQFSFDDLVNNFAEGAYRVVAVSYDGKTLVGEATFTHDVPVKPAITTPTFVDSMDNAGDAVVAINDLVVSWEPTTETVFGKPLVVTGYEVIITKVDHDDPNGWSQPIYDVHLAPDRFSLSVPAEFLEAGTVYELEVLVLEESGNQTIHVGYFTTE